MPLDSTPPLILASTSAYRRELLGRLRTPFDVVAPDVDETPQPGEQPRQLACRLAMAKARAVAARHPQGAQFMQSLSVAGVNGTAARLARGENSRARGNAWIKTGSLRDVSGIAGYVNAANGARYVLVGFINHPNAPAARPALDALLEWTASLPD